MLQHPFFNEKEGYINFFPESEIFLLHRNSSFLLLHIYAVRNLRGAGLHPSSIALPLYISLS